jgi:hypothetical protein
VFGLLSDGLPQGAVVGAGYWPGEAVDLTCWRVLVWPSGYVRQDICEEQHDGPDQYRTVEVEVGQRAVEELLELAQAMGFAAMPDRIGSGVDDVAEVSVAVRLPSGVKCVEAEWDEDPDHVPPTALSGLLKLWHAVQRMAPEQRVET